MNAQLTLDDALPAPTTRRTARTIKAPYNNTPTSKAAAKAVDAAGTAARDRRRILQRLALTDALAPERRGLTREELGEALGMDGGSFCPRVAELLKLKFVEEQGTRKTTKGKSAKIVHITQAGRDALQAGEREREG